MQPEAPEESPATAQAPVSTGSRVVRNSLWNTLNFAITLPIGLYLTPFVFGSLGDADYGVWAMIGTFTSLTSLANLGISTALTHFVAAHHARGETDIIDRKVNTAFVVYCIVAALVSAVLMPLMPWLARTFFQVPPARIPQIVLYLRASTLAFFAVLVFTGHFSIFQGLQRFDLLNINAIAWSLVSLGGTVWLLGAGYGLEGLVWFSAAQMLVSIAICWLLMKSILPAVGLRPWRFCAADAAEILRYSVHVFLGSLSGLMMAQLDRLLIGYFLEIRYAGYYQVPSDLVTKARAIPSNLIGPLMAAASHLAAKEETEKVRQLYLRGLRYALILGLPGFLWLVQFAAPFVTAWIGPGKAEMVMTLQVLALAHLANVLTGPGTQVLAGLGAPQYGMWVGMGALALNLIVTVATVRELGYLAVVLGVAAGYGLAALCFFPVAHRRLSVTSLEVLSSAVWLPAAAGALASCVMYVAGASAWATSFAKVLLTIPAYSAAYGASLLLLGFPGEQDRQLVERHLPAWVGRLPGVRR
ncbi:MAG: oligosaccharide flippase family protein [Candidatus Wallbacteria bacterium]|nr:oligosaccharide flippase family protein [Candidatus Wallbacteria bacterium]